MKDNNWENVLRDWHMNGGKMPIKKVKKSIKHKKKYGRFDKAENIVKYLYTDTRPYDLHSRTQDYLKKEKVYAN